MRIIMGPYRVLGRKWAIDAIVKTPEGTAVRHIKFDKKPGGKYAALKR